ncbi:phage portal protein [Cellulomonas soli]|uniref:phage portal protein n=1 Tax=Cellulomonas soli TaxID=931535 RepID=UPI003F8647BA
MGIFSWWRTVEQAERFATLQPSRALASPFAGESTLSQAVVLDDVFRAKVQPVTRAEAMSVPAIARARNLVCGVLARQPMKAYRGTDPLPEQPTWLTRSRYFPPRLRALWTIDDCIFFGWSLWVLDRGAADTSGRRPILDAYRVDPARWKIDQGRVIVTDRTGQDFTVPDDGYVLIPGPSEGLLTIGAETIRAARDLERMWMSRVKNPTPIVELRYTDIDAAPTEDEARDARATYIAARQDPDGVVMVTPPGLEVVTHGDKGLELFVQGRNAVSLDVARFFNMPASMLDASQVNGSSIDYENNAIGRSAYYDITLRTWALPIEEALSQDDVLPAGQYAAFDLSALTTPDAGTGPALED